MRRVEPEIRRAIDLMECADCAARYIKIGPGSSGIVAALTEASDTLCDVMDMLGITETETD